MSHLCVSGPGTGWEREKCIASPDGAQSQQLEKRKEDLVGISIGLVGLGQFGQAFADLFRSHPLVDRVALCDREPERLEAIASRPGWDKKFDRRDMYESLDDLLKTDVDAVAVITQPWLHAPQCIQAMEAGKHVYSAVPMHCVPDGDEILEWCQCIVETAKRTGLFYMLGETTYYRPEAMFCRRKAEEGAFGNFVYAEGEYFHDVDAACNLRDVERARLASKSGREWLAATQRYRDAGIKTGPMHYPTHSVSGPVSVMKARALEVTAYGYRNRNGDPYFEDRAFSNEMALFRMSNGATLRICECREIFRFCGDTSTPFCASMAISSNNTSGSITTPLPITQTLLSRTIPHGTR